jgi:osmoprotectant transport system permease protein
VSISILNRYLCFLSTMVLLTQPGECAQTESLTIGSKNFPESHLLGEMMTQMIEAHTSFAVEHKSGLGGTLICFEALKRGQIDIYPEYTGTAWAVILKESELVVDPLRTFLTVQTRSRLEHDLEWLSPFGLNDTYALAMRSSQAEQLGIKSISELVHHAGELTAGFSFEFLEREDGYPGLGSHYGLKFGEAKGIEHALAYEAVSTGSIDVMDAYSTDGKLRRYELTVLVDDRNFFPPYHAAPVVRGEALRAHPELGPLLNRLAFRLSDERMMTLNHQVEVLGRGFDEVARDFLVSEGLVRDESNSAVGAQPSKTARGQDGFWSFFVGRWRETLRLSRQHLFLSLLSVLIASVIAIPLGIAITRARVAARLALGFSGVAQTIPSLALLAFMIAVPGLGLTTRSAVVALTLYAILPILRNAYTGIRDVDPELIDAAQGLGLTQRQVLLRIQLPLAMRTIMAGIRTATVISIGFATLAAFIGAGGLGEPILTGLYLNDTNLILAGALPAAVLALLVDAILGRIEKILTPRGLEDS